MFEFLIIFLLSSVVSIFIMRIKQYINKKKGMKMKRRFYKSTEKEVDYGTYEIASWKVSFFIGVAGFLLTYFLFVFLF